MKSEVTLILASITGGVPIYTLQLRYWRAIHSEFMTHRAFSRNASSSRAVPVDSMLKVVREAPATPQHWGLNQKGMQAEIETEDLISIPPLLQQPWFDWAWRAGVVCDNTMMAKREDAWVFSAHLAASMSGAFSAAGYHKQIANRLTEPFQMINVVVTATDWENFFELRDHEAAMPEFQELARNIRGKIAEAEPTPCEAGGWHIPYILDDEQGLAVADKLILSTARCASVSYRTVEGALMGMERAREVYGKLMGSKPWHASPAEHQAQAQNEVTDFPDWRSNLRFPWVQHRKLIETKSLT